MKLVDGTLVTGLADINPIGTVAQEAAFEEWYQQPEAFEGFCRKTAFIRGWEAAEFEHRRELDRLRADNATLRAVVHMPPIADEAAWEAYMDALAAEVEALGAEIAALHYASAVANGQQALEQRDRAEAQKEPDVEEIEIIVEAD